MLVHLRPAIVMLGLFTALTGIIYPLAITGVAQIVFPRQANGSRLFHDGKVAGSALIGQSFSTDRYFHGRPSATSAPDPKDETKTIDAPYNAANSAGSNLGPTSQKLIDRVKGDIDAARKNGITGAIAADAVTTSASGLDPHISPQAAFAQVGSVALARHLSAAQVRELVNRHVEVPILGFIGEARVNVLVLNLALDEITS